MITQEEYLQMKEQLLSITDENEALEEQIQKYQAKNSQIPLLKQELQEAQIALEKMNTEFEQAQLKLNEEFTRLSSQNNSNPDLENKLSSANEKLQNAKDYYQHLFDEEATVAEQLAETAANDNNLQLLLEESVHFFDKYDIVVPQLQASRFTGILVEDLLYQVETLNTDREAQHGRRFRLNGWKQQAMAVNETQKVALSDLERDLKSKLDEVDKEEEKLSKILNEQAQVETKQSELGMELSHQTKEVEIQKENTNKEIENAKKEISEIEEKIKNNENDIQEMRNTIQNYKRNEKKKIQKKLGIVRDLEKRLTQERQNLPLVSIDSPIVSELTKTIDAEMREKEKMQYDVKELEKQLKRYQEDTSRKTIAIQEFSTIPPFDEPVSDELCYKEFLNFVKETEIKHLSFVSDLQSLAELLACAEQENSVLRETLSEIENQK